MIGGRFSVLPSHPEDGWTLARRADPQYRTGEDHLQSVYALGPKRSLATSSSPRSPLPANPCEACARQFQCEGASLGVRWKRGEFSQAVGVSRGGRSTEIDCLADGCGRIVTVAADTRQHCDAPWHSMLKAFSTRPNCSSPTRPMTLIDCALGLRIQASKPSWARAARAVVYPLDRTTLDAGTLSSACSDGSQRCASAREDHLP